MLQSAARCQCVICCSVAGSPPSERGPAGRGVAGAGSHGEGRLRPGDILQDARSVDRLAYRSSLKYRSNKCSHTCRYYALHQDVASPNFVPTCCIDADHDLSYMSSIISRIASLQ